MDIKKMIATIQIYIFLVKDVEVNIQPILPKEMPKLLLAYTVASNFIKKNNIQIKPV